MCRALEGLALVTLGEVAEGMRHLDEATAAALAGEVGDARMVETICCHLITACTRVRDFDRAAEWCRRVEEIASRHGDVEMFATCRVSYGEVLLWRGAWPEAERTLTAACRELAAARARVVDGLVRLAELRRRQGRTAEAVALLDQCSEHWLAGFVRAALALDAGDALRAAEEAERFLRRVGASDRLRRVPGLELLVRARLALGRSEAASAAAEELEAIAAAVGTAPLRGAALLARGRLDAAARPDVARPLLEDAADLLDAAGLRLEAAQARLELAAALRALGREDAAAEAEAAARRAFAALGATVPALPAAALARAALTPREREVLRLLAHGRSNDEIAAELVLSVRTVEHHVAGAYAKIGASGRSARAAATAYALAHGLG